MKISTPIIIACAVVLSSFTFAEPSQSNTWEPVQRIEFTRDQLPENLYSMFTGNEANSVLQYCLPTNYSLAKKYPLIVYVPGYHGHPDGNIGNAQDIANNHECVVVSLPLFKADVNRSEFGQGIIIGFADYPVLSMAYKVMLERFSELVPNIDPKTSAMVGFSNGALALAVLISSHDTFILEQFHSFCLVDHGMFHLTDLHKTPTKDRRFLILVGDEKDLGRELKIRGAILIEDVYQLLGMDIESRIMKNTGHELTDACKKDIGTWFFAKTTGTKEER